MDPITATMNAIAAFFQFAATPAGQKFLSDIAAVNEKIASDVAGLISHINNHAQKQDATATPAVK